MILPPEAEDGLGIAILNSNAETHFFLHQRTRAGIRSNRRIAFEAAIRHYPAARWIVALHHHVVEYPMPVKAFWNASAPH